MKVTIYDSQTGKFGTLEGDFSSYAFEEGNYSCDCNRMSAFACEDECVAQRVAFRLNNDRCLGSNRFIVVQTDDLQGSRSGVHAWNSGYSLELVNLAVIAYRKHLSATQTLGDSQTPQQPGKALEIAPFQNNM